jgi:pre-mRNA-processing factor 17
MDLSRLHLYIHTYSEQQDPLNQTSLVTRPTDTQMNVNIPYSEMTKPLQGPENPFGDRNRFLNQNALAGHVEVQAMSDHAFKAQHLTHSILGYSANPSVDPNAPSILGSIEKARENGFATLDAMRSTNAQKKELKRKRKNKGDLEIVEGDGSYVGPWASWDGEDQAGFLDGVEEDTGDQPEEEEEPEPTVVRKKMKPKRGGIGQETSVFHGKSMTDYQGRTYMHPPVAEAPHLSSDASSQETFIPKTCIHTWTGHTQGVSVIRLFPGTGHLLLSGSMDTKIKVRSLFCPVFSFVSLKVELW